PADDPGPQPKREPERHARADHWDTDLGLDAGSLTGRRHASPSPRPDLEPDRPPPRAGRRDRGRLYDGFTRDGHDGRRHDTAADVGPTGNGRGVDVAQRRADPPPGRRPEGGRS